MARNLPMQGMIDIGMRSSSGKLPGSGKNFNEALRLAQLYRANVVKPAPCFHWPVFALSRVSQTRRENIANARCLFTS